PVDLSESLEHQREQRLPAYICVTLVGAVQKPGEATTRWAICRQALAGAVVLDDVKRYVPPVLVQLNAVNDAVFVALILIVERVLNAGTGDQTNPRKAGALVLSQDAQNVSADQRFDERDLLQIAERQKLGLVAEPRIFAPDVEPALNVLGPIVELVILLPEDLLLGQRFEIEPRGDDVRDEASDDAPGVEVCLVELRRARPKRPVVRKKDLRRTESASVTLAVVDADFPIRAAGNRKITRPDFDGLNRRR